MAELPAPQGTSSASAYPITASTPTPTLASDYVAPDWPEQVFAGDCDSVLAPETARKIFDADVVSESTTTYADSTRTLIGGIGCRWNSSDTDLGHSGWVTAVIDTGAIAPRDEVYCYYGPCWLSFVSSGMLIELTTTLGDERADGYNRTDAEGKVAVVLAEMRSAVEDSAAAASAVTWNGPPAGSWVAESIDCEALKAAFAMDALYSEDIYGGRSISAANDSGEPMSITTDAANIEVRNASCFWSSHDENNGIGVGASFRPGQGFAVVGIPDDVPAELVNVSGSDLAYLTRDPDGGRALFVQIGVNLLRLGVSESGIQEDDIVGVAERAIAILG
jgi:hypothetical protein